MSHDVHLTRTFGFKVALVLPLLISVILISYFGWREGYVWDFTLAGVVFAYEKFKLFLSVAALVFPSVALVASNHRSKQTVEQIKITHTQNIFSNYIKHREEFMKYLDVLESEFSVVFKNRVELYGKIFQENSYEKFIPRSTGVNGDSCLDWAAVGYNSLLKELQDIKNTKMARRLIGESFCLGASLNFSAKASSEESIHNIDRIVYWAGDGKWCVLFRVREPFLHLKVVGEVLERLCIFSMHKTSEDISGWCEPSSDVRVLCRDLFNESVTGSYNLYGVDSSIVQPRAEFLKY